MDYPVIRFFIPFSGLFILSVFFGRYHVLDNRIFEFQLVCELKNSVIHIISFSIKIITNALKLLTSLLVFTVKFSKFVSFKLQFLSQRTKLFFNQSVILLFFLQSYFKLRLLLQLSLQLFTGLFQFLLLSLGYFDSLGANKHFFFHLFESTQHLFLFSFLFLLFFLSLSQLFNKSFFFFLF